MENTGRFRVIKNTWIPMSDGARLAARIWLPEDAPVPAVNHTAGSEVTRAVTGANPTGGAVNPSALGASPSDLATSPTGAGTPVPAVLEYIPYRKNDIKALRDYGIHAHFAARGYASVRVDLRGSGDSDGLLNGEYLEQELLDGLEVIEWVARQPWCNGAIGMMGLSWGGFNALMLASRQPAALKAIITASSSDDRFADDVHYMGGALLSDNMSWAANMFAFNSFPPDPKVVGENRWEDMWLDRLENNRPWAVEWMSHQRKDEFWRQNSVSECYEKIQCPVYAIGGFADGYTNTVFRLIENLDTFTKGLVGPWGHKYPHQANPGRSISFLNEAVRWWDRWLKGMDNGIETEPRLQVWMQDSYDPLTLHRPGRWVGEESWPSARIEARRYHFDWNLLTPEPVDTPVVAHINIRSPLYVGLYAGKWCSYNAEADLPWDQRLEDGGSTNFDTAPLEHTTEILGAPEVFLRLTSSEPVAMVAARLSAVSPEGEITRITYGVLNLTHREGSEKPNRLEPGVPYDVRIPMNHVAQRFQAGYQIRLSLSTTYWPLVWPSPKPADVNIELSHCWLDLPERHAGADSPLEDLHGRRDPNHVYPHRVEGGPERRWEVRHNLANNESRLVVQDHDARVTLIEDGLTYQRLTDEYYRFVGNRYGSLEASVQTRSSFERGRWKVRTETTSRMVSTPQEFVFYGTLDAYKGEQRFFSRNWEEHIPREYV